jgi:squalene-hopene/tetraprenyl-beta-curcumene cyclase
MNAHAENIIEQGAADAEASAALALAIERARHALVSAQHAEGYWCYELEADCTIPSEYILLMHYMNTVRADVQAKIAVYLRERQLDSGGWPLYYGGTFDMSCSVKAYYALKLAGDDPGAEHMQRARETILARGGAARSNVFTRITLALFGQVPWRAVPFIPVELILFPRWFPFHISKVSYWSRAVMVPLLVLCSLKPRARNPSGIGVGELFVTDPERETGYFPVRSPLNHVFFALDRVGRTIEPLIPRWLRRRALRRAEAWFSERMNGLGGLGAIFPAMVNAYEALDCLGHGREDARVQIAAQAIDRLLVIGERAAYCQPCLPPVWDTGLACLSLQEAGDAQSAVDHGLRWLKGEQLLDEPGDWRESRPHARGGGWPFQFENDYYPDVDDTSVAAWTMHLAGDFDYTDSIERAIDWICAMQSRNGGFGAFDVDNTYYYLNEIPFADHGALLDPPTADVTARCATLLALTGAKSPERAAALKRCLSYLLAEQEQSGAWFGRWGTNYVYGTWSVLVALEAAGIPSSHPAVRRAVRWLKFVQRADGGWGEDNDSYSRPQSAGVGRESTSFQTAWALLGLMAAGEAGSPEVKRGAQFLINAQRDHGLWEEPWYTAPGFPRVFYLKYHGYSKYFPLWALARYRNLTAAR